MAGLDAEFLADGVMIPTREGYCEMKMAIYQLRRGEPADPDQWADRQLPPPAASVASAATADSGSFSAWWTARAQALGIDRARS